MIKPFGRRLGVLLLSLPTLVWGHATLLQSPATDDPNPAAFNSPLPRVENVRMKDILPCGGLRGEAPASVKGEPTGKYNKGETIRVHWKETTDHSGVWRIDISPDNEKNWHTLLLMKDGVDEVEGVNDLSEEEPRFSWADVTLPAGLVCENCTFRLTQSMGPIDDENDYYSCADITIQ
ncbi:MAG: hypothetical protein ACI9XC_000735 [Gammaproteobacteria bacterium]|jgi:hypothetical protein